MNYSLYADAAKLATQFGVTAPTDVLDTTAMTKKEKIEAQNFSLGNGYVKSENNTILFKESIMGIEEISISYNDTGAQGVYTHELWDILGLPLRVILVEMEAWLFIRNLLLMMQVLVLRKVLAAEAVNQSFFNTFFDFNNSDGKMGAAEGQAAQTVAVSLSDTGLSSDEICYSTKKSDAYKNVWRYGVYDSGGARVGRVLAHFQCELLILALEMIITAGQIIGVFGLIPMVEHLSIQLRLVGNEMMEKIPVLVPQETVHCQKPI